MTATTVAHHMLLCAGSTCTRQGAEPLLQHLKGLLRDRGLREEVVITTTACLGGCGQGPNGVVYPDGAWYQGLTEDALAALLAHHLDGALPPHDHLRPAPGCRAAGIDRRSLSPGPDGFPRVLVDAAGTEHLIAACPQQVAAVGEGTAALLADLGLTPAPLSSAEAILLADGELLPPGAPADVPVVRLRPGSMLFHLQGNLGLAARLTGREAQAAARNRDVDARLAAIPTDSAARSRAPRLLCLDARQRPVGYVGGLGTVLWFSGANNIAAEARALQVSGAGLDAALIAALSPEVVLLEGEDVALRARLQAGLTCPVERAPQVPTALALVEIVETVARRWGTLAEASPCAS